MTRNTRTCPAGEVREATVPAGRCRLLVSTLKKYTSPISVLVGPGPTGAWLIFEEISESRP